MFRVVKFSFLATIVSVLFLFLFNVALARVLGPEMRGEFGYLLLFANLIYAFSNLGLHDSYIFFKRKVGGHSGLSTLFIFVLFLSLALSCLLSFLVANHLFDGVVGVSVELMFILFLMHSIYFFVSHMLLVYEDMAAFNVAKVLRPMLLLIGFIVVIFACKDFGVYNVSYMHIAVYLLLSISILHYVWKREFAFGWGWGGIEFRYFMGYAAKSYGVAAVAVVVSNFDKIYFFVNDVSADFGIYIAAFSTSRLIALLPNTFSTILFSKFAGKNEDGLARITSISFSILFIPMLILSGLIGFLSIFLLPVVFGEEYHGVEIPFAILTFEAVISSLAWVLAQRFMASGMPGYVLIRQLMSLTPLVLLLFLNIEDNLPVVVASAVLLGSVIRLLVTLIMFKNALGEPIPSIYYPVGRYIDLMKKVLRNE